MDFKVWDAPIYPVNNLCKAVSSVSIACWSLWFQCQLAMSVGFKSHLSSPPSNRMTSSLTDPSVDSTSAAWYSTFSMECKLSHLDHQCKSPKQRFLVNLFKNYWRHSHLSRYFKNSCSYQVVTFLSVVQGWNSSINSAACASWSSWLCCRKSL